MTRLHLVYIISLNFKDEFLSRALALAVASLSNSQGDIGGGLQNRDGQKAAPACDNGDSNRVSSLH
jgi:hypothetical protein